MNWLTTLLQRPDIGWADALDIGIVAILVYELLLLIRGTRAAQMALSAGFILLLYFLSQWLQLETVNWVIRNLAAYVVFAIIVLFQADIRRALAHFGRAPFFRYFERAEHADETIEELVTAATNLAARHRAALGLTEENDAIAIVVSEETGTISLAMGGDLERDFSAEQLRSRLATLLGHRRRRFRRVEEARSSLA